MMKTRLTQARLFVIDEMSMVGRQMLGKIEFKVRDVLRGPQRRGGEEGQGVLLEGRDAVLSGDPKQANPDRGRADVQGGSICGAGTE